MQGFFYGSARLKGRALLDYWCVFGGIKCEALYPEREKQKTVVPRKDAG